MDCKELDIAENTCTFGTHCIPFTFPGVPTVNCAFSTSHAGSMSIGTEPQAVKKREALLTGLGLSRWVELHQVHGDSMREEPQDTSISEASKLEGDGACTRQKELALAIKTADCQPVLLTNTDGTAVAALHVGWRGNVMNFPAKGLHSFCHRYDLKPCEILAVRGPSLGPGAAQFINFEKEWPPPFIPWFNKKRRTMDLWSLTRHQLIAAGMLAEHIFSLDLCTYSLPGLFFSHRRAHTGRQVSLIWIHDSIRS